ncbi:MAG: hypothetical protein LBB64_01740 [Dysgonamonadaceae bacterium]|jgi:hypothetical protein|nr:hypothetical protein [Dysgonamonadaceae bacterium]
MNTNNDIYYPTIHTPAFYRDCISHAVAFTFDRMPDNSWRRLSSDQPLAWALEHLDAVTTHALIVRRHTLEEQNERWGNDKHLEVNFELRIHASTYIFSAEMEYRYLEYFLAQYGLNSGETV